MKLSRQPKTDSKGESNVRTRIEVLGAGYKRKYSLFLTVFVTGGAVLMLEILGTRIMSPFYGSTIYVWSSLISVTLVFLALGYFAGGKIADRRPRATALYFLIFLAGLSVVLLSIVDSLVLAGTDSLGPRWGALSSAFILFSFPMFFLGTISPYAIKMKAEELKDIGVTTGNLYGVSTIGSFVGAVLTGFILIPNFPISTIMNSIASLLYAVVLMGLLIERTYSGLLVLPLMTVFFWPQPHLNQDENVKVVYGKESLYGRVMVVDKDNLRFLLVNGASQTTYDMKRGKFIAPYLRLMEKAVDYYPQAKNVLILGLGGGGMDKRLRARNLEVVNVEIDPKVVEVAREYFGFDGRVIVDDARNYVRKNNEKYDLVVFDVLSGYGVVSHLITKEAFSEIKSVISPGGILTVNTLGFESHLSTDDPYEKAMYKTLKAVFPHVYVKATGYEFQNIVFFCSDSPLTLDKRFVSIDVFPDEDTLVLTDDYNPVETLTIPHIEAFRKSTMKWFGEAVIF